MVLPHLFAFLLLAQAAPGGQAIKITEINYHPKSEDDREEFIEIYNSGDVLVDLSRWEFDSGVTFLFPNGTFLMPGEYLVLCADAETIREKWGIANVIGDWQGHLSNDGEQIRLIDASGEPIQTFHYGDESPWPRGPDGGGKTLERIDAAYDADYLANWTESRSPSEWRWVQVKGLFTSASSILQLYLDAAGEALVTDVVLRRDRSPLNLLQNGRFQSGLTGWTVKGTHAGTEVIEEEGPEGLPVKVAHIVAIGRGSSSSLLSQTLSPPLTRGDRYIAELWVKPLTEGSPLRILLSGATATNGGLTFLADFSVGTPGRENSVRADDIPPLLFPVEHRPQRPAPGDPIAILATVIDDKPGPLRVEARWDSGQGENVVECLDDGLHGDILADDGVFGAVLGAFPQNTLIQYHLLATDSAGQTTRFPRNTNPGTSIDPLTTKLGIYVEPPGLSSDFPIYHLLITPADISRLTASPRSYVPGTFVADGQVFTNILVRFRGQTSLGYPKKHWKVKLNDDASYRPPELAGHPQDSIRNMNLNSSWGDKTFMREHLSMNMWRDAGDPYLMTWFCRIYVNGSYNGFAVYVEQPNQDFLRRNLLNPKGYLWKSFSQMQGGAMGDVRLKVPDLQTKAVYDAGLRFAQIVSGTAVKDDQIFEALSDLFDVENFIDYQALNALVHNCDQPAKNYLVYGDADTDRWTYFPWDMDLTLGRNYVCGEAVPAAQNALTNDTIWADEARYGSVFFGTRERPKCDGPWNGATDAFYYRSVDFREPLFARVHELNEALLKPEVLIPKIEDLRVHLRDEVATDRKKWGSYGLSGTWDFDARVNDMVGFVRARYLDLRRQLGDRQYPEPVDLSCVRKGDTVEASWKNRGAYESIQVYLNGELKETLPGDRESAAVALDGAFDLNTIRITTTANQKERTGAACAVASELPGYRVAIAEDFDGPPEGPAMKAAWSLNGFARHINQRLELTGEDSMKVGTAFCRLPIPAGDFIADFDFAITGTAAGGEGMTFAWIREDSPEVAGGTGSKLGFFGLRGLAVEFDTAKSTGETSARHVGIDSSDQAGGTTIASADMDRDFEGSGFYHCRVARRGGAISVVLSNPRIGLAAKEVVRADDGGVQEDMLFGFTAATGSARSAHRVDNFVLRIPEALQEPVRPGFEVEPESGRAPAAVAFANSTVGIGVIAYEWDFGDGEGSAEESPVHVYTSGGAFDVTLTAIAASGNWRLTKPRAVRISSPYAFIRGDGDLDGSLNLTDVRLMLEHMFVKVRSDLPCTKQMDVNDSGTLEIADPVRLLRHFFQSGAPPPAPFPKAGADPTPDGLPCSDVEP